MCNAHNHPPFCQCGWGGSSNKEAEDKRFRSLFGTTVARAQRRRVSLERDTITSTQFDDLFDQDTTQHNN